MHVFKFQINSGAHKCTVAGVLKTIWRQEGILGMFKGNGTNVIRIFPYSAVQFASYEMAKKVNYFSKYSDNCSGVVKA